MARRRGGGSGEEVEGGMTSMLDLIFNILAYFVVTFNPPKPEKNFDVALPPVKIEKNDAQSSSEEAALPDEDEELMEEVRITLNAGPNGSLARISVQGKEVAGGIPALARQLQVVTSAMKVGDGGESVEAAQIVASPKLKYAYVVQAVDACYKVNIKKIGFSEAPGGAQQ